MVAKIADVSINHAIELIFTKRMTISDACKIIKANPDIISKHIRARGLIIPRPITSGKQIKQLPNELIASQYNTGISELELSKLHNVSRGTIRRSLIKSGVQIRGQSEANIVSLGRMTFEERQQRTKSANNALRGAKQPRSGCLQRAITAESCANKHHIGHGEEDFAKLLAESGVNYIRQKAVDIYNIDFCIGNVAVELKHGRVNKSGGTDIVRGRIKKLRECGFITVYVYFHAVEDLAANFSNIIAHVNILNSNPSSLGEYWVIWSRFKDVSVFRNNLGQYASVASPKELFTSTCKLNY